jgi:hypothetical protein
MDFVPFAKAVNTRLEEMGKHELLYVEPMVDLFQVYLEAFPVGSNPVFRQRTAHDCSCCKNFIRNFGKVVCVNTGAIRTVWDVSHVMGIDPVYAEVARKMDHHIKQVPIEGVFRTKERGYGAKQTLEPATNHVWNHLWGMVEPKFRCDSPDRVKGEIKTDFQTSMRALTEIKPQAVADVLELIKEGALYRGAEHERNVRAFNGIQENFLKAPDKDIFIWNNLSKTAANFRNSVIGTLVVDISNGVPLEDAVKMFESKVAPYNYKRTKALITPGMIDKALEKITELGLDTALERRFAVLPDISVNDALFVDRSVRGQMKDGLREKLLEGTKVKLPSDKGAEVIKIGDFMTYVVPLARQMSVLVTNTQMGNFVSLTAPVHDDAKRLLAWKNNYAWSYQGEVADSVKERVKRAGGKVDAPLRVSLSWFNFDDLDLHVQCPDGHIHYANKNGILDVDMNAGHGQTREPVENLAWTKPKDGTYKVFVNQYNRRETSNVGFDIEIQEGSELQQFSYKKPVSNSVPCFTFTVEKGVVKNFKAEKELEGGLASKVHWGIETQKLIPVSVMMKSPNHWDGSGQVGQRHWFFMLEGCINPEPVRGFYNEFLRPELAEHRKVFEILGAKTKCPTAIDQLSGVGFTEGRNDKVLAKVVFDNTERLYNISF